MGSIAMDQKGNIALGYSVSSETTFPSIRYAGRLAIDPLGILPQVETELIAGSGYQETIHGRWGDYSMMSIDPTDDCTFWYTQEYYGNISTASWQTRVGSFVFPSCLGPVGYLEGTVTDANSSQPIEDVSVMATAPLTRPVAASTNASGEYAMIVAAGTYTVSASKYGYLPGEVTSVPVISGSTTVQDLQLTAASFYTVTGTVDDSVTGWPLYAHISVQGDPFDPPEPDNDLWTDPVTGAYSVVLAEGITYSFVVDAWVEGYETESRTVGPLTGDAIEDISLNADEGLCLAPGYSQTLTYFEDFEASDGGYVAGIGEWEWGIPTFPQGISAFSGVNVWGTDLNGDASDPPPDAHVLTTTLLTVPATGGYLQWWDWYGAELADTREVYADGVLVYSDAASARNQRYWDKKAADLNAWAGQSIEVEFVLDVRGGGTGPDGWYIDDVSIAEANTCLPADGGLVIGNVYEEGTMSALTGAEIWNDSGEMTLSMATPDDANVDDAFFTLFSPVGSRVFTATMSGYAADIDTLDIVQGTTMQHSFFLPQAIFGVTLPDDMASNGMSGAVVTYTVQITNDGNVEDTFDLSLSGNAWVSTLSVGEITLASGDSGVFFVWVTIREDAPNGADDTVIVTATSQGDPGQSDSSSLTTTAMRDDYLVDLPLIIDET
jgi:hypothetical protein